MRLVNLAVIAVLSVYLANSNIGPQGNFGLATAQAAAKCSSTTAKLLARVKENGGKYGVVYAYKNGPAGCGWGWSIKSFAHAATFAEHYCKKFTAKRYRMSAKGVQCVEIKRLKVGN